MHPAEIGLMLPNTREPDTASTVGGKDADMGLFGGRIAPGRVCNAALFLAEILP